MSYSVKYEDLVAQFGYGYVDDLAQYQHIVKVWAYTDMQPRTIAGLGEFRKDSDNYKKLDDLYNNLAAELHKFIVVDPKKNETDFDEWHKGCGNCFVSDFNNIIAGHDVDKISFGKAQKIINVSFKYIYCLKGAEKYQEKFEHCHMVLDRYTYGEGFYKKEVLPWYNTRNAQCPIDVRNLTSWSNLSYDEYMDIQKHVREFLDGSSKYCDGNGKKMTPFQVEFYVFDEYMKTLK